MPKNQGDGLVSFILIALVVGCVILTLVGFVMIAPVLIGCLVLYAILVGKSGW